MNIKEEKLIALCVKREIIHGLRDSQTPTGNMSISAMIRICHIYL